MPMLSSTTTLRGPYSNKAHALELLPYTLSLWLKTKMMVAAMSPGKRGHHSKILTQTHTYTHRWETKWVKSKSGMFCKLGTHVELCLSVWLSPTAVLSLYNRHGHPLRVQEGAAPLVLPLFFYWLYTYIYMCVCVCVFVYSQKSILVDNRQLQ